MLRVRLTSETAERTISLSSFVEMLHGKSLFNLNIIRMESWEIYRSSSRYLLLRYLWISICIKVLDKDLNRKSGLEERRGSVRHNFLSKLLRDCTILRPAWFSSTERQSSRDKESNESRPRFFDMACRVLFSFQCDRSACTSKHSYGTLSIKSRRINGLFSHVSQVFIVILQMTYVTFLYWRS